MLVLTRKTGESVHIGDDIQILLVRQDGQRVRLGIDAPESTPIVRGELLDRDGTFPIRRHPLAALAPLPEDLRVACEMLRLALARRDSTGWHDAEPANVAAWLRALRGLLPVHERTRKVS